MYINIKSKKSEKNIKVIKNIKVKSKYKSKPQSVKTGDMAII